MRGLLLVAAAVVLAVTLGAEESVAVRCRVPGGKYVKAGPVSWWAGHKVYDSKVAQDSQTFIYVTSQHAPGQYELTTVVDSPLGVTLNELKKPAADVRYVKWNDQPPDGSTSFMANVGHTKGVIGSSDGGRGFWIAHSWPQFADAGTGGFGAKQSRPKAVSQHFFCVSIDLNGETPEILQTHLALIRPQIYDVFPKGLADGNGLDAAWDIVLGFGRKSNSLTNFMAKDLLPLIPDAQLQREKGALTGVKLTKPSGTTCGGGESCAARKKAKASSGGGSSGSAFGAGVVQVFASSQTNQPGAYWSALGKFVFPGSQWILQTWLQAAVPPNRRLDENVLRADMTVKEFACFPNAQSSPKGTCVDRSALHSKVAVSASSKWPVVCFGDVNTEQTRSAGMLCVQSAALRQLYAMKIYNIAADKSFSVKASAGVEFARVDKCVSAATDACTVVTRVESLADALAYADAHKVDPDTVVAVPRVADPKAKDADSGNIAKPCELKPNPCAAAAPFPWQPPSLSSSAPELVGAAPGAGVEDVVAGDWLAEYGWTDPAPVDAAATGDLQHPDYDAAAQPAKPATVPGTASGTATVPPAKPVVPAAVPAKPATVPAAAPVKVESAAPAAAKPAPATKPAAASSRVDADLVQPMVEADEVASLAAHRAATAQAEAAQLRHNAKAKRR